MAHVTLYLEEEAAERLRAAAAAEGLSQSRWVARLVAQKLATEWPQFVAELAGAWKDLPTAEELRQGEIGDAAREEL